MTKKRKFTRGIKIEAVMLVTDRGVAVAQAARYRELADCSTEERARAAACRACYPEEGGSFFRARGGMKFAFLAKHSNIWPVGRL